MENLHKTSKFKETYGKQMGNCQEEPIETKGNI